MCRCLCRYFTRHLSDIEATALLACHMCMSQGGRETFPEHWSAIALEPMSALADAYNNGDGLTVLSSQETFTGTFGIRMGR